MSNDGKVTTVAEQQQVEAPVSSLVLPIQFVGILKKGSATPSVLNVERWIAANTAAINIVNFVDGQSGQCIKILGDGFTTVNNNTKIKTNTAANKLLAANKVYTFTKFVSDKVPIVNLWVEDI